MSVDPNEYDVGELREIADGEATDSGGDDPPLVWADLATAPSRAPDYLAGADAAAWGPKGTVSAADPDAVFASSVLGTDGEDRAIDRTTTAGNSDFEWGGPLEARTGGFEWIDDPETG